MENPQTQKYFVDESGRQYILFAHTEQYQKGMKGEKGYEYKVIDIIERHYLAEDGVTVVNRLPHQQTTTITNYSVAEQQDIITFKEVQAFTYRPNK